MEKKSFSKHDYIIFAISQFFSTMILTLLLIIVLCPILSNIINFIMGTNYIFPEIFTRIIGFLSTLSSVGSIFIIISIIILLFFDLSGIQLSEKSLKKIKLSTFLLMLIININNFLGIGNNSINLSLTSEQREILYYKYYITNSFSHLLIVISFGLIICIFISSIINYIYNKLESKN